jgi:hypothetical protein
MWDTAPERHRGAMTIALLLQWLGLALGAVGATTLVVGACALPLVDDVLAEHGRPA